LGMPKELIDGGGNLAWAAAHSAYGAVIATEGPDDVAVDGGFVQSDGPRVESPFRLLGQVHDEDADLSWTRFRCFDANTGTWISTDPLEVEGGLTLYGFDGSPTNEADILGLTTKVSCKPPIWTSAKGKTPTQNAYGHYKKHGHEFDDVQNAKQYVEKTHGFVSSPPPGTLTKKRANGETVLFEPSTDTFAVVTKDGAPKTMFKPDPSKHGYATNLDYFNAQ
jgi:RHS repeat-associated protein